MVQITETDLNQFIGTEHYYKHWLGFNYTDGVKYLAEKAKAYWLLDLIGSYQSGKKGRKEPFQIWTLEVNEDNSAVAYMKEDSNSPILVKQEIPLTDFPLKTIQLYLIDGVLLLPSEY